jgi:hypothetical protein
MITNEGCYIVRFQQFSNHKVKLQKLMQLADSYSSECETSTMLAPNLGFAGQIMPVIQNAADFSDADLAVNRLEPANAKQSASRAPSLVRQGKCITRGSQRNDRGA